MVFVMEEVRWDEGGAVSRRRMRVHVRCTSQYSIKTGSLMLYALMFSMSLSHGVLKCLQISQTPTLNANKQDSHRLTSMLPSCRHRLLSLLPNRPSW